MQVKTHLGATSENDSAGKIMASTNVKTLNSAGICSIFRTKGFLE